MSDFLNANSQNFFPSANSALKNSGDATHTTPVDFNASPRDQGMFWKILSMKILAQVTVGAYQWAAANPGWVVVSKYYIN